jgi:hypothetical protein
MTVLCLLVNRFSPFPRGTFEAKMPIWEVL